MHPTRSLNSYCWVIRGIAKQSLHYNESELRADQLWNCGFLQQETLKRLRLVSSFCHWKVGHQWPAWWIVDRERLVLENYLFGKHFRLVKSKYAPASSWLSRLERRHQYCVVSNVTGLSPIPYTRLVLTNVLLYTVSLLFYLKFNRTSRWPTEASRKRKTG